MPLFCCLPQEAAASNIFTEAGANGVATMYVAGVVVLLGMVGGKLRTLGVLR